MSRNNNVRGPTSALTEFLKESGINPTTIARRRTTQTQAVAGPSNLRYSNVDNEGETNEGEENGDEAVSPSRSRQRRRTSGYASDELDEPAEEQPANKKRKLTKAAEAKLKAKAKKKAKDDEDYDDDGDEDAYTALPKSLWTNNASAKPSVGSFETCVECEKQFTVTKYTRAANPGPGYLCHPCAKASGTDPFKKPAVPRKRKAPADKRTVVNFEERRFPSLASLCIKIISLHIDDVEALGDIGAINMEEICKAISKNRSLTVENAALFYDAQNDKLTLFDGTKLTAPAFCTLALLNPNLTSLRIDYCGCLNDAAIATWCTSLPSLTRLELLGPFLVRVTGWTSFFESHPQLKAFLITQSPRFDLECIKSLVDNCQGLQEVRLKEVGMMEDGFLDYLKQLKSELRVLDLSDPGSSLSEQALIELMGVVGPTLTHLDLSKHDLITDTFLEEGLKPHLRILTSLTLSNVPELTDDGVTEFFNSWKEAAETAKPNPPLTSLDLSRNDVLSSTSLCAILAHSGSALQRLSINGWKSTSNEALTEIPKLAKALKWLDIGWCREVDDFVIKRLVDKCERVQEVKVWGCNRVTDKCPRKRGVSIYGVETQSII